MLECQSPLETANSQRQIKESKTESKDEEVPMCNRVVCNSTIPGFDYKTTYGTGHKYIPPSEVMPQVYYYSSLA